MRTLSWKITDRCNYHCPYHSRSRITAEVDTSPHVLNLLSQSDGNWLVAITGGEPFLFPNFVKVCQRIPQTHQFSIDTNPSVSPVIAKFAETINPRQVDLTLASLHIGEWEKHRDGLERFIRDAQLLQEKGFKLKVVHVLYPPFIPRFESDYVYFKAHDIPLFPKPFKGSY